MRCPRCRGESPENARFCMHCAAPFATGCAGCGAELPAGARFCPACARPVPEAQGGSAPASPERDPRDHTPRHLAEKILTTRSALEGERKRVTVLFADVRSSMEISEHMDPEAWHRILERFFEILTEGIHRYEGVVNQYTGDGVMALFGAPIAHEDHGQRACYAGLWLREPLRAYTDELRRSQGLNFSVRMGLNSGEVVVGRIGDDLRMDYTAQGHTVGLAQRMEQLAEPGKVYMTEHTARLAEGYFRLRDLGAFALKGVSDPVRAFELEDTGAHRTRLALSQARGFSRFVGRHSELEVLEGVLDRANEGKGQIVGVVGEAGVGKSRLCFEFLERVRARGIPVWESHCPAHGRSISMLPIVELARSFFGVAERDDPAEARRKVAGTLVLLDPSFQEALPLFFDLLRVPDPAQEEPQHDPAERQRRLLEFVRRLLEARSAREPAVLLMDDLHWIDAESDAFLAELIGVVTTTRTVLLTNFRPEYGAQWMGRSDYQQIALAPLGAEASEELLADLLGADPSLDGLRARIRERSGGNPFFTEELVHGLVEGGALEGERGAYRPLGAVGELRLPSTVHAVLAARIDRLGERDKELLQTAAVIGREFDEAVLTRVVGASEAELQEPLDALRRAEFVFEASSYPVTEYSFKHPLTHEVAYTSQLAARRRELHAAVAAALEETAGAKLDERAALLAHHWEQAGEPLAATRWHRRAAEWEHMRNPAAALRHWVRARELLAPLPEEPEILALRSEACREIMFRAWFSGASDEEWWEVYEEGRELAKRAGDERTLAVLLSALAGLRGFAGEHRAQVELLEEALERASGCGDFALEASLYQRIGWSHGLAGDNRRALAWTERGLAFCERDPGRAGRLSGFDTHIWFFAQHGYELVMAGRLDEAEPELERALALAREAEDGFCELYAHTGMMELAWVRGDLERMKDHALSQVDVAERGTAGGLAGRAIGYLALGSALVELEEWGATLDAYDRNREFIHLLERRVEEFHTRGCVGRARAAQALGEEKRARAELAEARELMEQMPDLKRGNPGLQLDLASAALAVDGLAAREEAEEAIARALDGARARGYAAYEPFALRERAHLASRLGDAAGRERDLREARRLFEALGVPLRVREVEAELAG